MLCIPTNTKDAVYMSIDSRRYTHVSILLEELLQQTTRPTQNIL